MYQYKNVKRIGNVEFRLKEPDLAQIEHARHKYAEMSKNDVFLRLILILLVCADAVFTYTAIEKYLDSNALSLWILTAAVSAMVYAIPHLAGTIQKDAKLGVKETPKTFALILLAGLSGIITVMSIMRLKVDYASTDQNASALQQALSNNLVGNNGWLLPLLLAVVMATTAVFSFVTAYKDTNFLHKLAYERTVYQIVMRALKDHFSGIKTELEAFDPKGIYLDNYEHYRKTAGIISALNKQYKDLVRVKFGQAIATPEAIGYMSKDRGNLDWKPIPYEEDINSFSEDGTSADDHTPEGAGNA